MTEDDARDQTVSAQPPSDRPASAQEQLLGVEHAGEARGPSSEEGGTKVPCWRCGYPLRQGALICVNCTAPQRHDESNQVFEPAVEEPAPEPIKRSLPLLPLVGAAALLVLVALIIVARALTSGGSSATPATPVAATPSPDQAVALYLQRVDTVVLSQQQRADLATGAGIAAMTNGDPVAALSSFTNAQHLFVGAAATLRGLNPPNGYTQYQADYLQALSFDNTAAARFRAWALLNDRTKLKSGLRAKRKASTYFQRASQEVPAA